MVNSIAKICKKIHTSLSRHHKKVIFILIDLVVLLISLFLAFAIRFETLTVGERLINYLPIIIITLVTKLVVLPLWGLYRPILRHVGLELFYKVTQAIALSYAIILFIHFLFQLESFPRSIVIMDALLSIMLMMGGRLLIRWCLYNTGSPFFIGTPPPKAIIYGAGKAGTQLAQALSQQQTYQITAFVDDNPQLQRTQINGISVYSPNQLPKLVKQQVVKTILLAIPSAEGKIKQKILDALQELPVTVKTVPSLSEIIGSQTAVSDLREIDITDLLGREEIPPIPELLNINITGKSVLVTGAGGSIGAELCRQIAQHNPRLLILYERNEYALYQINQELRERFPELLPIPCLDSVTNEPCLRNLFVRYNVDTVYHAAAYKHVPLVEDNPAQGVINNVYGTLVAASSAQECGVNNFVFISTDKAVRPTNVMGATKRVGELILQALTQQQQTKFVMVRFGNVLDSNGSVVPRFREQIANRQPITVTHPEITRYFMSIPEAARLVIQAGALGQGGEVFLLDMGQPIKIYDLALNMIQLSGLEVDQDIELKITGLRPGEKLHEELLIDSETSIPTQHPKIYTAQEQSMSWDQLKPPLDQLLEAAWNGDQETLMQHLYLLVPEFEAASKKVNQAKTARSSSS